MSDSQESSQVYFTALLCLNSEYGDVYHLGVIYLVVITTLTPAYKVLVVIKANYGQDPKIPTISDRPFIDMQEIL